MSSIDPLALTGLICSRLCHDLVGPVGAVVNGVELLSDAEDDEELREQSLGLLGDSAAELTARLNFFRIAFGFADDSSSLGRDEAAEIVAAALRGRRIQTSLDGMGTSLTRAEARRLFLLALIAADCLPRGGRLGLGAGPTATAEGERCALPASHERIIAGDEAEAEARTAPLVLLRHLAAAAGLALSAASEPGRVVLRLAPAAS
ncbi:histidine phosphotransferase family protein [Zavarzinia sp.]|uniref:histidine phosphotransferase family protein n=1 Tax=Zavarzinia sp. TaxID=2027920 RepID=UPI003561771A